MNAARAVLDELAMIGATIEVARDRLILRAGLTAIPATLVSRVREAKTDLMATLAIRKDHTEVQQERIGSPLRPQLKDQTFEANIVDWMDQHPAPSPPGRCARCGRPESHSAVVLPFGTELGTHTWLHAECWPAWHRARRAEAIAALRTISIRIRLPKTDTKCTTS
jgi:hypothetical protein